jgi:hypothetical protein
MKDIKTVGLFEKDVRIHYIDLEFVVVNNPHNGNSPVILMRHLGEPSADQYAAIASVLNKLNMMLVGQPSYREDGLWYQQVREKEVNLWAVTNLS